MGKFLGHGLGMGLGLSLGLNGLGIGSGAAIAQPIVSEIVPDTTLGAEASQVIPLDDSLRISGGAARGVNLFHSFETFNIGSGDRVYFEPSSSIAQIFSRVTGDRLSQIDGTLGVLGNADLFLLNPNGIVFGPSAQLDLSGSLVATTATAFQFPSGDRFGTETPTTAPLLSVQVTPGLQYGSAIASIESQANLNVGQDLTLAAHRLALAGSLSTGRDLTLQGQARFLSGADYTVGGYLFTQDLSGIGIDLLIPHEQVIMAEGDVQLEENYTGSSLHILAGGQVTQQDGVNEITIEGAGAGTITETIANGVGGTQQITVSVSAEPTLDIRSGVDWNQLGGSLGNQNTSGLAVSFAEATTQDLTIGNVTNEGGAIALVSAGDLTVGRLDSATLVSGDSNIVGEAGGRITLSAARDILTEDFFSNASVFSEFGDLTGGSAGAISLRAGRDIQTALLFATSSSFSEFGNIVGGQGASIFVSAGRDIMIEQINAGSTAAAESFPFSALNPDTPVGDIRGGDGGAIHLVAGRDITAGWLESISIASSISGTGSETGDVVGGQGGSLTLSAGRDLQTTTRLQALSIARSQTGGNVQGGHGGEIRLSAGNNLQNTGFAYESIAFAISENGDLIGGQGGDILLEAQGDIGTGNLYSFSLARSVTGEIRGGEGGTISLLAPNGTIQSLLNDSNNTAQLSTFSFAGNFVDAGQAGAAGDVTLEAATQIRQLEIATLSSTEQSGNVQIRGLDHLEIIDTDIVAGRTIEARPSVLIGGAPLVTQAGGAGASGDIEITGAGDLSFIRSSFNSDTNGRDAAGDYVISSPGWITFQDSKINSTTTEQGAAGNINLMAGQGIRLAGDESSIRAETLGSGPAGSIRLQAPQVRLEPGSSISTATASAGTGGSIEIEADQQIELLGSQLSVETSGQGTAGNVILAGDRLHLNQATQITATATATATASNAGGRIQLNANHLEIFGNSQILSETQSITPAGTLTLQPYSTDDLNLRLGEQSRISASTAGEGPGGNLVIQAPGEVSIRGEGTLSAETQGNGLGGNIRVAGTTVAIADGPIISTTARRIEPRLVDPIIDNFFNVIDIDAGGAIPGSPTEDATVFQFTVPELGNTITDVDLRFSAAHSFDGDLRIALISPEGTRVSLLSRGAGREGDNFQDTRLDDEALIAITDSQRNINSFGGAPFAGSFRPSPLTNQGSANPSANPSEGRLATFDGESATGVWQLEVVDTFPETDDGTLFRAGEAAPWGTAIGTQLLLSTRTVTQPSTLIPPSAPSVDNPDLGRGGTITFEADTVNLQDTDVLAATEGLTRGGDIDFQVGELNLDNARVTVRSSGTGDGGNIQLNANRTVLLRNQSLIETDAGGSGNGGNIAIDAPFLIGLPNGNSDIIANALSGDGGQINITTQNLFNFEQQDGQNRQRLRATPSNDISASSETGTNGTIVLDTPDIDPERGVAELPSEFVDQSNAIARRCAAQRGTGQSSFVVSGRGGLPSRPGARASATYRLGGIRGLTNSELAISPNSPKGLDDLPLPTTIAEATAWQESADGTVVLLAGNGRFAGNGDGRSHLPCPPHSDSHSSHS